MEKKLQGRDVWIWGGKTLGISAYFLLKRMYSIQPAGIIDNDPIRQSSSLDGVAISSFESFLKKRTAKSFLMLASSQYADEMAERCESIGLKRDEDYAFAAESMGQDYQIDISNVCNLSCPSCPNGNFPEEKRYKGFIGLDLFKEIVDKALRETPNLASFSLFYLGENFLVKDLPLYIEELNKRNVPCFLSSNLNVPPARLEAILRAKPHYLRISTSGYYQETYQVDHRGGNVNILKSLLSG